ncbi:NTE family protein [Bradyrhizobium yuanmingense]|uniref:patatin-like phospholipase family protein n=1 Tax=Bradyrhizobium yuanmingense TaxID=108015 RepID=UPI0035141CD0
MITDPVHPIPTDDENKPLEPTNALCLSGGGYRAMVFHVGVLWRLYETGLLKNVRRISSVSGGSITAGMLALAWPGLSFTPDSVDSDFIPKFVAPLRAFAGITIDAESVILGALLPGSIGDRIAEAYDDHLFRGKTLQDMPDEPRFVINATNVQSGALWRFMKPYMRDYRVGEVKNPEILLAQAVAASSAFPPVLSPFELRLKDSDFVPGTGLDLQRPPFTTRVVLSDGGVYDNLGLETAWKRHQTVLVSDAGGKIEAEEEPETDWPRHSYRILNLIDNQVRSLRKRQVIDSFKSGTRKGAYWGIRTDIANYGLADALPCPFERTLQLAEVPTRLKRLDATTQERLINWGYAVCDAALRKHLAAVGPPPAFPYPQSGV